MLIIQSIYSNLCLQHATTRAMAVLSIIIPTFNAIPILGPTLAALAQMEAVGLVKDVIVSDGGSTDDTAAAARETGAVVVEAERGRGTQLQAGADAATGDWLLFLHADTVLAAGWADVVRAFIARPAANEQAGYFTFVLDDSSLQARRIERLVRWRNRVLALPYGDQGLLLHRSLFRRIGGYRSNPLMEDVDIVRRLGRRRLRPLDGKAITSAARYRADGYWRRPARNLCCLGLYYLGVSPVTIRRIYD